MTSSEKFSLKWNDYQDNISIAFSNLRNDTNFSDVTLVSEDGQKVEAHKVIISASSPIFNKIINLNKHPQPMIYMKGFKAKQLNSIIDFIYQGVADIYQEDLEDFLAIAEELQLKGLTGGTEEKKDEDIRKYSKPNQVIQPLRSKDMINQDKVLNTVHDDYDLSSVDKFYENKITTVMARTKSEAKVSFTGEDLKSTLWSMIVKDGTSLTCTVCGKTLDKSVDKGAKDHMERHVESLHVDGVTYECGKCKKTFRSKTALHKHIQKIHNINK